MRDIIREAAAAIGFDGANFVAIVVQLDGSVQVLRSLSERSAYSLVEQSLIRQQRPDSDPDPRLVDGRWYVTFRCPDGIDRRFSADAFGVSKPKPSRDKIPAALRFTILERDGHTCRYCGRSAPAVALHVDHIVALANGGTMDPDNLVTACVDCNLGKSDR